MAPATLEVPSRALQRHLALGLWLEDLCRIVNEHESRAASGDPLVIDLTLQKLILRPWVVAEIGRAFRAGDDSSADRALLVAQSVALRMKVVSDRAHLQHAQAAHGREIYAVQAELLLDTAIAMALKREIQHVIDEEVRCGRMTPAKRWTDFKNDLNGAIGALKKLLADSEKRRAELISDKLTDQPRGDDGAPDRYVRLMQKLDTEDRQRKRLASAGRKAREALANLPSRTELLFAALAVAAVIWLGFVKLPDHLAAPPASLTVDDFPRSDGFLDVRSRPPSLYVTVDGRVWSELGESERSRVVSTISSVLMTSDYTGALLTTEEGRPVAQWLAATGVTLIETDETRQPTADVPILPPGSSPAEESEPSRASTNQSAPTP